MRLIPIAVIVAACAILPRSAGITQTSRGIQQQSEVLDYLIQNVCVDASLEPVAGDPASCPRHRDLEVGEALPYVVTDFDQSIGRSLSFMSSVPALGTDGKLKIVVVKSLEGGYNPDYSFTFKPERDAFDLIDVSHSAYASIIRTFDGGCFDQIFARSGGRRDLGGRAGGWVLFPLAPAPSAWGSNGSLRLTTFRMQVTPAGPRCADNQGSGVTSWAGPQTLRFESGKSLTAIRSDHFAAADITQPENSFERFILTREYGMTRWESWWTRAHCVKTLGEESTRCRPEAPSAPLRVRCGAMTLPGNPVPGLERRGGQDWIRMDCRDTTRYVPLKRPQLPLSPEIARGGGLVDIDYAATLASDRD